MPPVGDAAWLRGRYLTDQAPVSAIAAEAGVNPATVYAALRRHDIPLRGKPGARAVRHLDRDWLSARIAEGATPGAIARDTGMDRSSVLWQLAQYGLLDLTGDGRYASAVNAAERYRKGQSLAAISAALGVDRRQVSLWLLALGVQIRPPGRRTALDRPR
jgi:transposase-like protein